MERMSIGERRYCIDMRVSRRITCRHVYSVFSLDELRYKLIHVLFLSDYFIERTQQNVARYPITLVFLCLFLLFCRM